MLFEMKGVMENDDPRATKANDRTQVKEIGEKEGTKKKRPGEGGKSNPRKIRFMWTPHSSANNPCFCCWERRLNQSENLGIAVSLDPKGEQRAKTHDNASMPSSKEL